MTKMMIGISGRKYHGKDTCGNIFCNLYGFKRYAFADIVKEVTAKSFNINLDDLYDPDKKENLNKLYPFISNRKAMEYVGEKFREDFPRIWIERLTEKINHDKAELVVVTDLRHVNEAQMFDYTIRVNRPSIVVDSNSVSESSLDNYNFDYYINNDTIESVKNQIINIYNNILTQG